MITLKYQTKFMNKMNRNLHWINWLRIKANAIDKVAVFGLGTVIFAGKRLHWISDSKPIKSKLGRAYIRAMFNLAMKADYARCTYLSASKGLNCALDYFNKQVLEQNKKALVKNADDLENDLDLKGDNSNE